MRRRWSVVMLSLCVGVGVGGCSVLSEVMKQLTPASPQDVEEMERRNAAAEKEARELRAMLDGLRGEVASAKETLPEESRDRLAAIESRLDGATAKLDEYSGKVEGVLATIAKAAGTGAAVAGAIPGGQPVGGILMLLANAAALMGAVVSGFSKGGKE